MLFRSQRRNGKWCYVSPPEDAEMVLANNGNPCTIRKLKANVAQEALGIMTRPDGKMKDEREYLIQKTQAWADAIRTKKISRGDAWHALQTTIMKTLECPLMATSLSRRDVDSIMAPVFKAILPKLGLQKRFPHTLLYGSNSVQGGNVRDIYASQLVDHLQAILRHQHRLTPSAALHVENMELTQCHVGSAVPFGSCPSKCTGV